MKLNDTQIAELYDFTKKHLVEWYDLQTELVDHLANAIELRWTENPSLSFEEALRLEYKKFGVFGFSDVVDERRKFLNKKYNKLIWLHIKTYFQLPKLILTLLLIFIVFRGSFLFENKVQYFGIIAFVTSLPTMFYCLYKTIKLNQKRKKSTKQFLIEELILQKYNLIVILSPNFINLDIKLFYWETSQISNIFILLVYSILISLSIIFSYVFIFHLPKKMNADLLETYKTYEYKKIV